MKSPATGRRFNRLPTILASLLACGLSACATIVNGTTQVMPIVSTPSGARVSIDSIAIGQTPLLATVSRDRSHVVTVARDSGSPIDVRLGRSLSGWVFGNMFVYYLPALIDLADGAAFQFNLDTVRVVFPGFVTASEERRFGFATGDQVRFTKSESGAPMVYARVDSSNADQLFAHFSPVRESSPVGPPGAVNLADVHHLEFAGGFDAANNGGAGAHYASIGTWGLGLGLGAAAAVPVWGIVLGGYFTMVGAPIGYVIGLGATERRWAPAEAHRIGSPLLVDDRVRLRLESARGQRIDGHLVSIDSAALVLKRGEEVTRVGRTTVHSMQRADGFDFAVGAKRGLALGSVVGAIVGATVEGSTIYNPKGQNIFAGAALGAFFGLLGAPALAPRKWVNVLKW